MEIFNHTAIHGQLLYFLPVGDCGYSISASLSILKTIKGDTIRVLQLCGTRKRMTQNIKVKLLPNKKVTTKASIIPLDDRSDCVIVRTIYGRLCRNNQLPTRALVKHGLISCVCATVVLTSFQSEQ